MHLQAREGVARRPRRRAEKRVRRFIVDRWNVVELVCGKEAGMSLWDRGVGGGFRERVSGLNTQTDVWCVG
jgi:hypothetical protein